MGNSCKVSRLVTWEQAWILEFQAKFQVTTNMSTINELPNEVLELIFDQLSSAFDFFQLCLVCKRWLAIIRQMRSFARHGQGVYLRLPAAGSVNESHGNEGFAVIFQTMQDILLCGLAVFLPHGEENDQRFANLHIKVGLQAHGVSQIGPVGQIITQIEETLNYKQVQEWTGPKGCAKGEGNKDRLSLFCLPGSSWKTHNNRKDSCSGIHPYPLFFATSQPLIPGVKYLLSLQMSYGIDENNVATIWGFQGVPRIKRTGEDLFRWKQVYRRGLSSSVSSGQFPVLYFIK